MKLENEFTVPASVDDAWKVLLNVEQVAPCLPGAEIEGSDGDSYKGTMTVKIGPITAKYKGTIEIQEADDAAHRAVMRAKARDARGQGGAQATITSSMEASDEGTRVKVETDMRVTGAAAQFGRGVMQDVGRFADCLASEMSGGDEAAKAAPEDAGKTESPEADAPSAGAPTAATPSTGAPEPTAAAETETPKERPTPEVLDLGEVGRGVLVKRAVPAVCVLAAVLAVVFVVRRILR